jgi:hypothetical protein
MFRDIDIDDINTNIDKIKNSAALTYKENYEPTLKESEQVYKIIQNYIKINKRIVYGGYAQHLLIKNKNEEDGIYTEINDVCFNFPDIADMEFYSPEPLKDIVNLTNELYNLNFKYIEAKEAVHGKTYKIYVNMINYCDFSFMPNYIYNNIPVITIKNFLCCHPHFMLCDAYRVLNDPLTSYWRLDKPIKRFQKILRYYPITLNDDYHIFNKRDNNINNDILRYIRKKIIHKKKLIVIGQYGYNYYVREHKVPVTFYELISTNFKKDSLFIYKKLKKHFGNNGNIKVIHYYPFYEFIDYSIEFYYNNILILKIIKNYERCIVYNKSIKKKTYFGTNNLVFMHLLFNYFYSIINKNEYIKYYMHLINNLYNYKRKYLTYNNKTVLDISLFQDFTLKCQGTHVDPLRKSYLIGKSKIANRKPFKFTYIPDGTYRMLNYQYDNISGRRINNDRFMIIKKK